MQSPTYITTRAKPGQLQLARLRGDPDPVLMDDGNSLEMMWTQAQAEQVNRACRGFALDFMLAAATHLDGGQPGAVVEPGSGQAGADADQAVGEGQGAAAASAAEPVEGLTIDVDNLSDVSEFSTPPSTITENPGTPSSCSTDSQRSMFVGEFI